MKIVLLSLHLLLAGLWLGCILTEALFERALLAGDRSAHRRLADLHWKVDAVVEIPAFTGVLLTGLALLAQPHAGGAAVHLMMGAGALALVANLACVGLVWQRRAAAQAGDWARFDHLDHRQHQLGAVVLLGVVVALGAGITARSGA